MMANYFIFLLYKTWTAIDTSALTSNVPQKICLKRCWNSCTLCLQAGALTIAPWLMVFNGTLMGVNQHITELFLLGSFQTLPAVPAYRRPWVKTYPREEIPIKSKYRSAVYNTHT